MITRNDTDININIQNILGTDCLINNNSPSALRLLVHKGFPFSVFEALQKEVGLSQNQLSSILGISTRTLTRRKNDNHFTAIESDILYRVARVVASTVTIFGDTEKARLWLYKPNRGLGGEIPFNLLNTYIGSKQVEDVLRRIKYGIYS
ncbi:MAG: antitoxin [Chloroflexi bacterium HGW-Chloroflexi-4]|jgi:putative toxin-antitoxin system antitoxin component (TIGR02293 family)|nr:MAG: antitoxin [Chloroflexi bacterium HGW-Chloroflexi-4]